MQLVLHTGVHYTEGERLVRSLLANSEALRERGVVMSRPGTYRSLFRDTLNAMHKTPASPEAREVLLDAVLGETRPERAILSDANFFRTPATAVREGVFYPAAGVRMARMAQLFPDDELEIYISIRNPATLLPILHRVAGDQSDEGFWGDRTPRDMRWSQTIATLREKAPEIPITLWCNEDSPLLWERLLREMTGVGPDVPLEGTYDLLEAIMSPEGMARFRSYIAGRPGLSETQRCRVIGAFLDKFGLEEEIEEELDMPGWDEALVQEMSEAYDADLLLIEQIPRVRLITP
ncbi:hypothetical protein ACFSUD_10290 [Sulfitobacter aestuarii]|uniref:Sulfotransferase family protein n=1 Tax=Sulfitobacter aestuarii TaxID=2161676 RepID=A0ABW5U4X9_9RHOB